MFQLFLVPLLLENRHEGFSDYCIKENGRFTGDGDTVHHRYFGIPTPPAELSWWRFRQEIIGTNHRRYMPAAHTFIGHGRPAA